MSYSDVMRMPTQERKLFIAIHIAKMEEKKEKIEEEREAALAKQSGGKGSKTKTISGDAVKAYSGKK